MLSIILLIANYNIISIIWTPNDEGYWILSLTSNPIYRYVSNAFWVCPRYFFLGLVSTYSRAGNINSKKSVLSNLTLPYY